MEVKEQISRWRLILGQESDKRLSTMTDLTLTQEQDLMDQALASIYNRAELGGCLFISSTIFLINSRTLSFERFGIWSFSIRIVEARPISGSIFSNSSGSNNNCFNPQRDISCHIR